MSGTIRLAPDQLEKLADLIADRLTNRDPSALVDAATLARTLGVSRSLIYRQAAQLGARRVGHGQGRLRFDVEQAREALRQLPQTPERRPSPAVRRRSRSSDQSPSASGTATGLIRSASSVFR